MRAGRRPRAPGPFAGRREAVGYPRGELIGSAHEILMPEQSREAHAARRAEFAAAPSVRAMGGGGAFTGRRSDGSEILAEVNLGPVRTPSGDFVAVAVRDVSERVRIEQALRASQEAS